MNNFENMTTAPVFKALLSNNSEQALEDLRKAKRALDLTANRARIRAGHRLMNEFHRRIMNMIHEWQEDYGMEYVDALRCYPVEQEFSDEKFLDLIKDYMEYCYD